MDDPVYLSPEQAYELLVMLGTGDEATVVTGRGRYSLVAYALPSGQLMLTVAYVVGSVRTVWNGWGWELSGGDGPGPLPSPATPEDAGGSQ